MRRLSINSLVCLAVLIAVPKLSSAQGFKFLEVTVLDPDGKPLADVPVDISLNNTRFPLPTDVEGKVSVNVPAEENSEVAVRVRHEGHAAMAVAWRGGEEIPDKVTIPLTKGMTFGGIVHNEQGQPIKGVVVSGIMLFDKRRGLIPDGEVAPFLDGEFSKTDQEGRWQCSMGPDLAGEFQFGFSHPDYLQPSNPDFASWRELKNLNKIAVMEQGIPLRGQLLDPNGNAASQLKLHVVSIEDGSYQTLETATDDQGNFTTLPIRKGLAKISVENAKYAPLQRSVEVVPGVKPLRLKLDQGQSLKIKLINEAAEPLAGANVEVIDWLYPNRRLDLGENHTANIQGIWRWSHAPAGTLTFKLSAFGYRDVEHQLAPSDELQTIVLKPAIKVAGRVIDKATREPIEKFKLMGIATIDCGVGEKCLVVFNAIEPTTIGKYVFMASLLCHEFHVSCSAEGYKNGNSRTITPDEDQVQWDFELERETDNTKER